MKLVLIKLEMFENASNPFIFPGKCSLPQIIDQFNKNEIKNKFEQNKKKNKKKYTSMAIV